MEKYLCVDQLLDRGWKLDRTESSADGPTFVKDKYTCQLLIEGNINSLNACIKNANLEIRQKESGKILFLGTINTMHEFFKLCVFLNIN